MATNHNYQVTLPTPLTLNISGTTGSWSEYYANVGTYPHYGDTLVVDSVNTSGFRSKKKWQLPINGYSKTHILAQDPATVYVVKHIFGPSNPGRVDTYSYSNVGVLILGAYSQVPLSVPADNTLYQKCVAKIQDQIKLGHTNLGVTMAEASKTAAMVASTATRVANAIRNLRKLDIIGFTHAIGVTPSANQISRFHRRRRKDNLTGSPLAGETKQGYTSRVERFAAETWLEYTYGWKPLLQDVYSSAKAAAYYTTQHSAPVRSAKSRANGTQSKNVTAVNSGSPTEWLKYYREITRKDFCEIGVNFSIMEPPSFADSFGLNNPAAIAWELVPFSFVADWFIPIGTALESLSAYNGLTFISGYVSKRSVIMDEFRISPAGSHSDGYGGSWYAQSCTARKSQTELYITRSPLTSFPTYGWPAFKSPASVSHAISAVALLSSLFRK